MARRGVPSGKYFISRRRAAPAVGMMRPMPTTNTNTDPITFNFFVPFINPSSLIKGLFVLDVHVPAIVFREIPDEILVFGNILHRRQIRERLPSHLLFKLRKRDIVIVD